MMMLPVTKTVKGTGSVMQIEELVLNEFIDILDKSIIELSKKNVSLLKIEFKVITQMKTVEHTNYL